MRIDSLSSLWPWMDWVRCSDVGEEATDCEVFFLYSQEPLVEDELELILIRRTILSIWCAVQAIVLLEVV